MEIYSIVIKEDDGSISTFIVGQEFGTDGPIVTQILVEGECDEGETDISIEVYGKPRLPSHPMFPDDKLYGDPDLIKIYWLEEKEAEQEALFKVRDDSDMFEDEDDDEEDYNEETEGGVLV